MSVAMFMDLECSKMFIVAILAVEIKCEIISVSVSKRLVR